MMVPNVIDTLKDKSAKFLRCILRCVEEGHRQITEAHRAQLQLDFLCFDFVTLLRALRGIAAIFHRECFARSCKCQDSGMTFKCTNAAFFGARQKLSNLRRGCLRKYRAEHHNSMGVIEMLFEIAPCCDVIDALSIN